MPSPTCKEQLGLAVVNYHVREPQWVFAVRHSPDFTIGGTTILSLHITLAACAHTEWSRRRNVVGVAGAGLVNFCWCQ